MPVICHFFGIDISIKFDDHNPPHFHAVQAGYKAVFDINTMAMIRGQLPPRSVGVILEWGRENRELLLKAWEQIALNGLKMTIPPPKGA